MESVTVPKASEADGVQKATTPVPPVFAGAVAFVTAIPPAVYPDPDTSPVAVYAVESALIVAVARYKAALKASAAVVPRTTLVPKA